MSILYLLLLGYAFSQQFSFPIIISEGTATREDTLKSGLDPSATDYLNASLVGYELPSPPLSGLFYARHTGTKIKIIIQIN